MIPSLRRLRLRGAWLLILPFFYFARPTPLLLALGGGVSVLGLALRAWAAGVIHKERALSTNGPYAFTRNPLYLGSLLLGLGVVTAGGRWVFAPLLLGFFAVVYGATARKEMRILGERFGEAYAEYARSVPAFFPRLTPYRPRATSGEAGENSLVGGGSFTFERYWQNREFEALLGALAGFVVLALRWMFGA